MELNIKNIGIINDASISLNGVTVITGLNGSGKSTIGKTLASIFSLDTIGNEDFLKNILKQVKEEICNILSLSEITIRLICRDRYSNPDFSVKDIYPNLAYLFLYDYRIKSEEQFLFFLEDLKNEFLKNPDYLSELSTLRRRNFIYENKEIQNHSSALVEKLFLAIENSQKCLREGYRSNLYAQKFVDKQFDTNFDGQFFPVFSKFTPEVFIKNNNSYFEYIYNKNINFNSFDKFNFYYIFDSSFIDTLNNKSGFSDRKTNTDYNQYLLKRIKEKDGIFQITENKSLNILDYINSFYKFNIYKKDNLYFTNNNGLSIRNEASGHKVFLLLKIMLEKGLIDEKTILFFDEPENHLHPELQLKFARLVDMISSDLKCRIIIATHSPTLLYAIDKNRINKDNYSFYLASKTDYGSEFINVSKELSKAHKILNDPFIRLDLFGTDINEL